MHDVYFDKTEKGKDEISHRTYHLSAKLRPLLVIIDGKRSATELLKNVYGLGLTQSHLDSLLAEGFIATRTEVTGLLTTATASAIEASVVNQLETTPTVESSYARLIAVRNFFNETVKQTLGLRGFGLQLKVERAASLDDFIELRGVFLEAVEKHKGPETAHDLAVRLDHVLYQRDTTTTV
nr:hypothetical protein [uncultured Undibacterium sp.]